MLYLILIHLLILLLDFLLALLDIFLGELSITRISIGSTMLAHVAFVNLHFLLFLSMN